MARGFDSKFVEAQQDEAARERTLRPTLTPEQRARADALEGLQLSRARAASDLARAQAPAHRAMLEEAINALDARIRALDAKP